MEKSEGISNRESAQAVINNKNHLSMPEEAESAKWGSGKMEQPPNFANPLE